MSKKYKILTKLSMIVAFAMLLLSCSEEDFPTLSEGGLPSAAKYADKFVIEVDQEKNTATFKFIGADVIPVWVIDGSYNSNMEVEKFYRKAGEYSIICKVSNSNGVSTDEVVKSFTIDNTKMAGFPGLDYESEFNIWRKAEVAEPEFWYAPGWEQIDDPSYSYSDGAYTIELPEETFETWQAQMFIETDINTSADNEYDFSVIFTSTKDHSNITVKLVDDEDDDIFYFTDVVKVKANEPTVFWKEKMEGIDIAKLKLVLDFGGNSDDTKIIMESISLKNSADDDGTVFPEIEDIPEIDWVDVDSDDNLWKNVDFDLGFYYAPGWAQIDDPVTVIDGSSYSMKFPEETFERWQSQVFFVTEDLSFSADKNYDVMVTLLSSQDVSGVTVKLTESEGDNADNVSIVDTQTDLFGDSEKVFRVVKAEGADIAKAKFVFDFGGNPANTDLIIKDIVIQEHVE